MNSLTWARRGGEVRGMRYAVMIASVFVGIAAFLMGDWTTETFVGLTWTGHALVTVVAIAAALWSAVVFVRGSSGGRGTFELTELRIRSRSKWRLKGISTVAAIAAVSALLAWYVARSIVPHLGGSVSIEEARILRFDHSPISGRWCDVWVVARPGNGSEITACVEGSGIGHGVRTEITSLSPGKTIEIHNRHNWLGDSLDVFPPGRAVE